MTEETTGEILHSPPLEYETILKKKLSEGGENSELLGEKEGIEGPPEMKINLFLAMCVTMVCLFVCLFVC